MSIALPRKQTIWLGIGVAVLMIYVWIAIAFEIHCRPGRVAVVGLFGPVCVCKGAP